MCAERLQKSKHHHQIQHIQISLCNVLPSELLKIQNFQNSHVTMTSSISNDSLLPWSFWKEKTGNLDAIYFFVIPAFIRKCDKKTSHALFGHFWKTLLQSVANRENFTNFKILIIKCDKKLLRIVAGITK